MNVLILGSNRPTANNGPASIAKSVGADFCYIEDLLFKITPGSAKLYHQGEDITKKGYDCVLIFNCYYAPDRPILYMDIGYSIALILEQAGIPFWNSEMAHQRCISKLSQMVLLAQHGYTIPSTIFSLTPNQILPELQDGTTYIVKDPMASRGRDNYCLSSKSAIADVLKTGHFIVQPFVPNDHDLRVICFGAQPTLLLRRARTSSDTHLNNTSQGGTGEWIDDIPAPLYKLAHEISALTRCDMGGIDFIETPTDHGTEYCCLEVNSVPQLSDGTDAPRKMAALKTTLEQFFDSKPAK